MSGRDSIMGPETMQLPASAFSHLSGKSFSNLVPVLTDENPLPEPSIPHLHFFQLLLLNNAVHLVVCHLFCQVIQNAMACPQTILANSELITARFFSFAKRLFSESLFISH